MGKVSIGLVGLGSIAAKHLEAIRANPEYELASVCDQSEHKLRRMKHELGCEGFTDYRDLLARRPDVVLVALVTYKEGGSMFYEEVGYYPKPEWLNTGAHFVFEEGIVAWDDKSWRMMTRDGREVREPLPTRKPQYGPVYANMLVAISGQEYGPKAWEYAVDTAIAHAAYASSGQRREIDLTDPEWRVLGPDLRPDNVSRYPQA